MTQLQLIIGQASTFTTKHHSHTMLVGFADEFFSALAWLKHWPFKGA
ncbi:Uncharacterised protein [Vibrio cholerae]|nr:Uncharacterised protein [Vibrio cholerae]